MTMTNRAAAEPHQTDQPPSAEITRLADRILREAERRDVRRAKQGWSLWWPPFLVFATWLLIVPWLPDWWSLIAGAVMFLIMVCLWAAQRHQEKEALNEVTASLAVTVRKSKT